MSNKLKEFKSIDLAPYLSTLICSGCKENQFHSLPFSQAVASMYTNPQVISTSPKTIFD